MICMFDILTTLPPPWDSVAGVFVFRPTGTVRPAPLSEKVVGESMVHVLMRSERTIWRRTAPAFGGQEW